MWLDLLVFCDCGFQSICPPMEKDKRPMDVWASIILVGISGTQDISWQFLWNNRAFCKSKLLHKPRRSWLKTKLWEGVPKWKTYSGPPEIMSVGWGSYPVGRWTSVTFVWESFHQTPIGHWLRSTQGLMTFNRSFLVLALTSLLIGYCTQGHLAIDENFSR